MCVSVFLIRRFSTIFNALYALHMHAIPDDPESGQGFFCLLYAYYIYGGFGIRCLMNASVKMEFNFQASYGEEPITT